MKLVLPKIQLDPLNKEPLVSIMTLSQIHVATAVHHRIRTEVKWGAVVTAQLGKMG